MRLALPRSPPRSPPPPSPKPLSPPSPSTPPTPPVWPAPPSTAITSEEINHSWHGGLYAEPPNPTTFQPPRRPGGPPQNWTLIQRGSSEAAISIDTGNGPSAAQSASLKLDVTSADEHSTARFFNTGYWGIPVRPATTYAGLLSTPKPPTLPSALSPSASSTTKPERSPPPPPSRTRHQLEAVHVHPKNRRRHPNLWQQPHRISLRASRHRVVHAPLPLPPTWHDQPNLFRPDLMEKLDELHPKFLRFPGGNFLEGQHLADHFDWKKTIGPLVDRPGHMAPWMYRSSDGMGLLKCLPGATTCTWSRSSPSSMATPSTSST